MNDSRISMAAVLRAWNKGDISTAQLAYLQTKLAHTVEVLEVTEGHGLVTGAYRNFLERVEWMQAKRRSDEP